VVDRLQLAARSTYGDAPKAECSKLTGTDRLQEQHSIAKESPMADPIHDLDEKLRRLLRDAYDIGDSDAETLLEVATTCMKSPGVLATAAATGVAVGAAGGVVTVGTLTIPAWLAGVLSGYVGGTAVCVIHNFTGAKAIDTFLQSTGLAPQDLRNDVTQLLRYQRPLQSTMHSRSERHRFLRAIGESIPA
jgi:hypothetical protein